MRRAVPGARDVAAWKFPLYFVPDCGFLIHAGLSSAHPEHLLEKSVRADLLTRLRARELPGMFSAAHYKCG
jgi:hypothetical protein